MTDIIQLLPDSVANQIAAGEVIQRPASLLKELMENSIDAGASEIEIIVKDGGRTLVQVIDNGCGMTESDARMAFERHATSKIKTAHDLFSIRTKGFRGEALASIAAVAHVELITRRSNAELGTKIVIAGSAVESQKSVVCPAGSNFAVKNLFYNIPVRRRFLKSDATEFTHIINEFKRVVLTHPDISFKLIHNDAVQYHLVVTSLKQRIVNVTGKAFQSQLIPVSVESTIVNINGFTGNPQGAKKSAINQYFFVNSRYMRHPYLHRAITEAYSKLIAHDCSPLYFIYFDVNPELIDINIHPAKTEIKFEDESAIWRILNAAIRESLGKFNAVPSINFDTEGMIDIPVLKQGETFQPPQIKVNPFYNPFESGKNSSRPAAPRNWETLYETFTSSREDNSFNREDNAVVLLSKGIPEIESQQSTVHEETALHGSYFQIKNRYILTPVKSGLMIIDQRRAHERILFEHFMAVSKTSQSTSQRLLFPENVSLSLEDALLLNEIKDDLKIFGFDIETVGNSHFLINGIPSEFDNINACQLLDEIIDSCRNREINPSEEIREQLARTMSRSASVRSGETLTQEEMAELVNRLFRCKMPNITSYGKTAVSIFTNEELEQRFK